MFYYRFIFIRGAIFLQSSLRGLPTSPLGGGGDNPRWRWRLPLVGLLGVRRREEVMSLAPALRGKAASPGSVRSLARNAQNGPPSGLLGARPGADLLPASVAGPRGSLGSSGRSGALRRARAHTGLGGRRGGGGPQRYPWALNQRPGLAADSPLSPPVLRRLRMAAARRRRSPAQAGMPLGRAVGKAGGGRSGRG